jgi:MFS family permease
MQGSEKLGALFLPWLVCFSASLFFFYEFIQGNMFASIADNIMRDFHVQADKMAYLSSIYYVSNVIFLFVAGMLLDRFSVKKTLIATMLLCVVSTFILAYAQSFCLALFCRFATGIGSAFCFLGPVRLASRWFPPQRMALVTGVIVTLAMVGGMLAQYPLAKLIVQVGWRNALIQIGCLGIAILVLMCFGIIEKTQGLKQKEVQKISLLIAVKRTYFNSQTLRSALYTSLMNMSFAIYGAMIGTLYLAQRMGISKEAAALVNSMLFLGAIVGGPLMGWYSDRVGFRVLLMKAGALASFLTLLAVLFLPVSLSGMKILFFLLGFFTASQVISYALVAESSPRIITATAVSVVSILTQGGYIVYQNLFSHLLTKHGEMQILQGIPVYSLGDYYYAAMILPLGLIIAWLLLFGLKETYCQQVEE